MDARPGNPTKLRSGSFWMATSFTLAPQTSIASGCVTSRRLPKSSCPWEMRAQRYGALPDRPCRARASHDCDSTEVLDVSTYHGAWAHPQRKGSDARQCRIVRGHVARVDIVSMLSSFVIRLISKVLLHGCLG